MSPPRVSVVVPVWNARATLAAALASARAQTSPPCEIIVADDGSTDGSAEIAAAVPGVTVLRLPNRGPSAARNAAIAASRGEWIAPLDADDLWHPAKLQKQLEAASAAPRPPGFVYCWVRFIDPDDRIVGSGTPYRIEGRTIHRHLYRNFVGVGGQLLIRRDVLAEVGGYDERLRTCEDLLLQWQIASRHAVACVPEYLVGQRRLPGQASADRRRMLRDWQAARATLRATCPGVRHACDRWMDARQYYFAALYERSAGRRALALARLVQAAWRDPAWTGGTFAQALVGAAARETPHGMRFFEADPTAPVGDVARDGLPTRWLAWLEARRLRGLARLDAFAD